MKKHKLILLAVFTAISFLGMFLGGCGKATESVMMLSEPVPQPDLAAKLDEYMTAYNENCSYKYSGTILVAKGNTILLNKGYGMADYSKGILNTPDKVLAIGSMSKSFTALAIMQLAEKGLLNVNDPISKYITGHKRGKDITIHQLLTHTSGLLRDGLLVLGSKKVELKENLNYINKQPMLYEPGEKLAYSNAGYIMLAAIIEKVSGETYNDYIRDNIFIPLGMNSSRCGTDAAYGENQSVGYEILTGEPSELPLYNLSCEIGPGNIYSTTGDLYKYDRALYSEKLLGKEYLDKIFTAYPDINYGYGWEVKERFGHREISHGGHIGGYTSLMIRFPDDDIVLILLTNNGDQSALYEVAGTMSAMVLSQNYVMPEKLDIVKVSSKILKKYAGKYELGPNARITVNFSNSKLYTTFNDEMPYELVPLSETVFSVKEHENCRNEFFIDKNNNIILKTISNGIVYEWKKIN